MAIVLKRVKGTRYDTIGEVVLDTTLLEKGDQVAVIEGHWSEPSTVTVLTVERVTATQIVLAERTARYRRADGSKIGDYGAYALHWTRSPQVFAATQRGVMRDLKRATERLLKETPKDADARLKICAQVGAVAAEAARIIAELEVDAALATIEMRKV